MSNIPTVFTGEMQLMNWGESSSNGAWVKFWIAPEDLEAFRHLKCRSGKIAGHRMMAALAEIGDDEQPVAQPRDADPGSEAQSKGGALAKLAGMFCQQPEFWEFLNTQESEVTYPTVGGPDTAAIAVRTICGIESRADLDNLQPAADKFHAQIRLPFMRWKQGVRE